MSSENILKRADLSLAGFRKCLSAPPVYQETGNISRRENAAPTIPRKHPAGVDFLAQRAAVNPRQ
jgi:hypothetical protein